MSVLFPPRLAPGDVIGVTAPSSGVPEHLHPRLELAIKNLKKRGYQVREGRCLRSQHKNKSATKFSRVEELMSYLTDPDIKAVMPRWGGDLAMELLDLIDFDLLSRSKPKWFVGFSDLREGANKQVISSQADSLIKISRIWADFFPANTSNQPI